MKKLTHGKISGTFWQWLLSYYRGLLGSIFSLYLNEVLDPAVLVPLPFSGHLWFIQMLFAISVLTLPFMFYLKSKRGILLIDRLASWSARPFGIFLFVIPLAIVRVGLMWMPIYTDRTWAEFLWYTLYFIIGFILASDDRFTSAIKKNTGLLLYYGWFSS